MSDLEFIDATPPICKLSTLFGQMPLPPGWTWVSPDGMRITERTKGGQPIKWIVRIQNVATGMLATAESEPDVRSCIAVTAAMVKDICKRIVEERS